jgi:DNA-binding transcriptional ArsR family regulator
MAVDRIFEALASRPRREMLAYLSAQELTAGEIAGRFAMSAPAVSRHLSVLESAGLVSSERRGQFVYYRLISDNLVNTLTGFALEVCPKGGPLKRESRKLRAARKPGA